MAILSTDLKAYLSGGAGNTDPNASLGGTISTTQIIDAALNDMFDSVSGDEASAGDVEYRAFYIKNTHATLTWVGPKVWISQQTPGADDILIGIEASSGSPQQSVANESTAPSAPTISFSAPSTKATGLALGNMAPSVVYMIWIKRNVPAATGAYSINNYKISIEGDTAA